MYTLDDYEKAKAELQGWLQRWENYSGNNSNKYQADIKAARAKVRLIEHVLKEKGVLSLTERELDKAFPNAQSREVVEYKGRRYRRHFIPLEKSRSRKTVTEWGRSWEDAND